MAVKKTHKCPICGITSPNEEMVEYKKKWYHKGKCEEEYLRQQEEKENKATEWDCLFQYICKLYGIDKPTGMMFKQLETFRKTYGYTDIGMYYTLKYYYETLENEVLEDTGLGIIPYYYEQAGNHFNQIWDIEDSLKNFERNEKVRVIKVKPIKEENFKPKLKKLEIDWSDTENE